MRNFRVFWFCSENVEKNPILEILDFFFKIPLLQRPFFSKKKCLRSCSKLAQMKFRENKFSQFSSFLILLKNCGKKSDSSSKIGGKFSKKSSSDLAQNWLSCSLKEINFRNFRVFWFCSKNVAKNPIQVRKLGVNFRKKVPLILLKIGSDEVQAK